MVVPIWGYNNKDMGKPQSKVEIQENIVNNGNAENSKQVIPEYIITLVIVIIILFIAFKINKYFKKYVLKYNQNRNNTDTVTI